MIEEHGAIEVLKLQFFGWHWLRVQLKGRAPNTSAIGAQVSLTVLSPNHLIRGGPAQTGTFVHQKNEVYNSFEYNKADNDGAWPAGGNLRTRVQIAREALAGAPRGRRYGVSAVDALTAFAVATVLEFPFLEDIHVPTLMMGGVLDRTLNYQTSMADVYPSINPPKWFLTLNRGGHYTFTDMCRMKLEDLAELWGDAEDAMDDGCNPETNWNYLESHEATLHYAIAFLNRYLRDSPGSADYLTAEAGADFGDEIVFVANPE